jgi:pimeloyl-ACP methyl ester carboxylesterase
MAASRPHLLLLRLGPAVGARQMRALLRYDGLPGLEAIRCPTVVVGGEVDHRTDVAVHAAIAARIPGAALRGWPDRAISPISRSPAR